MSDEQIIPVTPVPEVEPEFKTTLTPAQLDAAQSEIGGRSFSGRHPEFGKMINCQVCGLRHREFDVFVKEVMIEAAGSIVTKTKQLKVLRPKCSQTFTYRVGDYEEYAEEKDKETGEVKLVPAYRTAEAAAVLATGKLTKRAAAGASVFARRRLKPHLSKPTLIFIEEVRKFYAEVDAVFQTNLERVKDEKLHDAIEKAYNDAFDQRLQRARVIAARRIRRVDLQLPRAPQQQHTPFYAGVI